MKVEDFTVSYPFIDCNANQCHRLTILNGLSKEDLAGLTKSKTEKDILALKNKIFKEIHNDNISDNKVSSDNASVVEANKNLKDSVLY